MTQMSLHFPRFLVFTGLVFIFIGFIFSNNLWYVGIILVALGLWEFALDWRRAGKELKEERERKKRRRAGKKRK